MNPNEIKVRDIMSTEVLQVLRNDKLKLADDLMKQERVRHLAVIDEWGHICSVVSQRDLFRGALFRALGYGGRAADLMLESVPVKEAMSTTLHTIDVNASARDAAALITEHKIGCLPVMEDDKLVGMVTETDLVKLLASVENTD